MDNGSNENKVDNYIKVYLRWIIMSKVDEIILKYKTVRVYCFKNKLVCIRSVKELEI